MTKSKADQLREEAQRQAAARAARDAAQTPAGTTEVDVDTTVPDGTAGPAGRQPAVAAPRPGQTLRVKPVKVTVELQPIEHQRLTRVTQRFAEELQLPRIAGAEVFRVLLDLMQRDDELAARVGQELGKTGGNRRR
jgi:hypothetical protein